MSTTTMSPLIGYNDVAQILGLSKSAVYGLVHREVFAKNIYLGHGRFNGDKLLYHIDRGTVFTDKPKRSYGSFEKALEEQNV